MGILLDSFRSWGFAEKYWQKGQMPILAHELAINGGIRVRIWFWEDKISNWYTHVCKCMCETTYLYSIYNIKSKLLTFCRPFKILTHKFYMPHKFTPHYNLFFSYKNLTGCYKDSRSSPT